MTNPKNTRNDTQMLALMDAEGLLWEARRAMVVGRADQVPVFIKAAVGKLNEAVKQR